jgi:hypothetical protein
MAIDDYTPTPVPDCVDTPDVNTWLQNLNALMEGALQGQGGVSCVPVEGALTDSECLTLDGQSALTLNTLEQANGATEKKIFLVSARALMGQSNFVGGAIDEAPIAPNIQINYAITAKCGGVEFASTTIQTGSPGTTQYFNANMIGECPAGSPIEICLDIVSSTVPVNHNTPSLDVILCGAMLCVTEPAYGFISDMPGFFCAPDVPEGCIIGREGLHLMQQNTRALCSYAARGYLEAACDFSFTFNDADTHVLGQPQHDVQYLIVGSARICASFTSPDPLDAEVNASITGGCSNGSTTSCFPVTQEIYTGGDPGGGTTTQNCFNVPFIACGNCLAGGSIFAGINTATQCSDTNLAIDTSSLVNIDSVEQTYTLFTFRRVDPIAEGLLPIFEDQPIDKCIARKSVEYLVEKADALFDYFCEINEQVISCNRLGDAFGPVAAGGSLFSGIIRPGNPPPPPPDPIPDAKLNVVCNFRLCLRNLEKTLDQFVNIDITISCASAPPYTLTVPCFIAASESGVNDSFQVFGPSTVCKEIPLIHTYSGCLSTDPVLLDIATSTNPDVEVTGSFDCLSFNI